MKKWLAGMLCLCTQAVFALSLSQEARQEAALFNGYLQAVYAQRQGKPTRFALLRKALKRAPDSAYLKAQLVAEAVAVDVLDLAEPYSNFIESETAKQDPDAWAIYGAYQWARQNRQAAKEAYEKSLELNPENEPVLLQYISVLAASEPAKAATALEKLAQERPALAPDIYTQMGKMYLFYQNYPAALEAFHKAVSLDSTLPEPRLGRAGVYEKTRQYFLMLHELEELDKLGFATAATLAQMGSVYVIVKDLPRAQTYFLRAKELENDNIPAGFFLAALAEQQGNYRQALDYLTQTADYAQSPTKQVQASYYWRKLGNEPESFAVISAAYKQFPDNGEVAYLYGVALLEREEYKKAAKVLGPLVEKFPQSEDARLQYAFALEGYKKYAQMEAQLNVLLEKNPRNAPALNLYAYSLAQRNTRLTEAADYIARALAVWPQDSSFIDTQAWVFYRQGKYAQAADIMRALPAQAVQENAELAYHAGLIEAALGNTSASRKYLEQSVQNGWKPAKKALKKLN